MTTDRQYRERTQGPAKIVWLDFPVKLARDGGVKVIGVAVDASSELLRQYLALSEEEGERAA